MKYERWIAALLSMLLALATVIAGYAEGDGASCVPVEFAVGDFTDPEYAGLSIEFDEIPPFEKGGVAQYTIDAPVPVEPEADLLPPADGEGEGGGENIEPSGAETSPEAGESIPIDKEHFPDDIFRERVSSFADLDKDGMLTPEEAGAVVTIQEPSNSSWCRVSRSTTVGRSNGTVPPRKRWPRYPGRGS